MTPEELEDWLAVNHATADELFVELWKKCSGVASNLKRFEELRAAGRVQPAGLATWEARDPGTDRRYSFEREHAVLSDEEWDTFPPEARAFWEAQPPGYRKAALHWVTSAKRPETRVKRLAELVADSGDGLRIKLLRR